MAKRHYGDAQDQATVAAIEQSLDRIESTVHLLVALRLVEDGHAPDMNVALAWARDLVRLRKIYPGAR